MTGPGASIDELDERAAQALEHAEDDEARYQLRALRQRLVHEREG
ncbi:hypothetical protein [Halosegnis marinus]|uniref:Uncharacterized protein n=1 Tax=Halosegnis marinus TaxID=3034023 RepID=A0ABD5ZNL3_9EURY|nr:hypothetical protein [Halosegnis sp. DT85]